MSFAARGVAYEGDTYPATPKRQGQIVMRVVGERRNGRHTVHANCQVVGSQWDGWAPETFPQGKEGSTTKKRKKRSVLGTRRSRLRMVGVADAQAWDALMWIAPEGSVWLGNTNSAADDSAQGLPITNSYDAIPEEVPQVTVDSKGPHHEKIGFTWMTIGFKVGKGVKIPYIRLPYHVDLIAPKEVAQVVALEVDACRYGDMNISAAGGMCQAQVVAQLSAKCPDALMWQADALAEAVLADDSPSKQIGAERNRLMANGGVDYDAPLPVGITYVSEEKGWVQTPVLFYTAVSNGWEVYTSTGDKAFAQMEYSLGKEMVASMIHEEVGTKPIHMFQTYFDDLAMVQSAVEASMFAPALETKVHCTVMCQVWMAARSCDGEFPATGGSTCWEEAEYPCKAFTSVLPLAPGKPPCHYHKLYKNIETAPTTRLYAPSDLQHAPCDPSLTPPLAPFRSHPTPSHNYG